MNFKVQLTLKCVWSPSIIQSTSKVMEFFDRKFLFRLHLRAHCHTHVHHTGPGHLSIGARTFLWEPWVESSGRRLVGIRPSGGDRMWIGRVELLRATRGQHGLHPPTGCYAGDLLITNQTHCDEHPALLRIRPSFTLWTSCWRREQPIDINSFGKCLPMYVRSIWHAGVLWRPIIRTVVLKNILLQLTGDGMAKLKCF